MAFGDIVLLKDKTPIGPFTRSRIQEGLGRGEFTPRDLAHTPGLKDWLPLLEVLHHLDREVVRAPGVKEARGLPPVPNPPTRYAPPVRPPAKEPDIPPLMPEPQIEETVVEKVVAPPVLPTVPPSVFTKPPSLPATERRPSPMNARIGAWIIDWLILFLPVLLTFGIAYSLWYARGSIEHRDAETARQEQQLMMQNLRDLVLLVANGFAWLYVAGLESSRWQGTIGKHLMGLVVVDTAGHRISFLRATGRHGARYLSALPLFLGFIVALFNSQRLTWHDRLSSTRVVKR